MRTVESAYLNTVLLAVVLHVIVFALFLTT